MSDACDGGFSADAFEAGPVMKPCERGKWHGGPCGPSGLPGFDAWAEARQRDVGRIVFGLDRSAPSGLPTTVAGRYEAVMTLLEGFPVYAECACGCGLETYVGHEPVITKAQAARLLEGI